MQVLHGYSDGNSKGKVVVPEPSFVIKTRDLTCLTDNNEQSLDISKYNNNNNTNNTTTNNNNGIKIFINIVYSDMIEPFHLKKMLPEQLNELKNNKNINHPDKNIKESEEDIAVRIPISIANPPFSPVSIRFPKPFKTSHSVCDWDTHTGVITFTVPV
eukprot:GHVR01099505.1.p1 GENE.GHVR01099505.1~~GHVR01099505.1.p1  ORF type:complete len:158 (-),score=59.70 GHVR01099505.1:157-630(-)